MRVSVLKAVEVAIAAKKVVKASVVRTRVDIKFVSFFIRINLYHIMSLVTNQPYLRSVYESRFNLCGLFHQMRRCKDDLPGSDVFGNSVWLMQVFKDLLGPVLPMMPRFECTLKVQSIDGQESTRMIVNPNRIYNLHISTKSRSNQYSWHLAIFDAKCQEDMEDT